MGKKNLKFAFWNSIYFVLKSVNIEIEKNLKFSNKIKYKTSKINMDPYFITFYYLNMSKFSCKKYTFCCIQKYIRWFGFFLFREPFLGSFLMKFNLKMHRSSIYMYMYILLYWFYRDDIKRKASEGICPFLKFYFQSQLFFNRDGFCFWWIN
jgi:hypothetical protein